MDKILKTGSVLITKDGECSIALIWKFLGWHICGLPDEAGPFCSWCWPQWYWEVPIYFLFESEKKKHFFPKSFYLVLLSIREFFVNIGFTVTNGFATKKLVLVGSTIRRGSKHLPIDSRYDVLTTMLK